MVSTPQHDDKYKALNDRLTFCLLDCSNGKQDAFSEIYHLTSGKFTAILMKMVRDETECADIMQKAYLSIWKNAHKFNPEKGKAFTWMLVIMRNRALDWLRMKTRQRETGTLSKEVAETLEDHGFSPEESTKAWMIRRLLSPHLATLSPEVAQAIRLSVISGMSAREIGEALGVPTNTAKSWVRRGLKRIRRDLEASGDASKLSEFI